mmetsp:Transcript_13664/g.31400  ORF Transcript_13664/g.31400 Transcript_13664/m.31400 type:complete len:217 (+) Transcript_13664:253-903(+)
MTRALRLCRRQRCAHHAQLCLERALCIHGLGSRALECIALPLQLREATRHRRVQFGCTGAFRLRRVHPTTKPRKLRFQLLNLMYCCLALILGYLKLLLRSCGGLLARQRAFSRDAKLHVKLRAFCGPAFARLSLRAQLLIVCAVLLLQRRIRERELPVRLTLRLELGLEPTLSSLSLCTHLPQPCLERTHLARALQLEQAQLVLKLKQLQLGRMRG